MEEFDRRLAELVGPHGFVHSQGDTAVLLIHGLTGTPAEMRHFGRYLARRGFSIVCPQLAGHCGSVGELKATRWQDWHRSIVLAFDLIADRYSRVFVAGLSMGALMALLLASERPSKVAGVILLSTTFFYDGWNVPRLRRKLLLPLVLHSPLRHLLHWREPPPYGLKDERARAIVTAILQNRDTRTADKIGHFRTPATVILEGGRLIKAARRCLEKVVTPTLVVHSTEDDMASIQNAHYVCRRIASSHVETFFIDDTYHVLTLDRRKDDVAQRVADFCAALRGPVLQGIAPA